MKKVLWVGLTPKTLEGCEVVHCPLITIQPKPESDPMIGEMFRHWPRTSHLIFTSPRAVHIFSAFHAFSGWGNKWCVAVGSATAAALRNKGATAVRQAAEETAEGVVALLSEIVNAQSYCLFPRSTQGRALIPNWLREQAIPHYICDLYDTLPSRPAQLPDLALFDEVMFTSPSTVSAFLKFFGKPPEHLALKAIGAITHAALRQLQE